ncbi:MAG: hypothetical protein QXX41_15055 [Nitrososphaerota archaeon]
MNDVIEKVLVFKDENGEFQILDYRTRFTDISKAVETVKKLEEAFEIASKEYLSKYDRHRRLTELVSTSN